MDTIKTNIIIYKKIDESRVENRPPLYPLQRVPDKYSPLSPCERHSLANLRDTYPSSHRVRLECWNGDFGSLQATLVQVLRNQSSDLGLFVGLAHSLAYL